MLLAQRDRVAAVTRLEHGVAATLQYPARENAHHFLVFDKEYRLRAGSLVDRLGELRPLGRSLNLRQIYLDARPVPHFAVDEHIAIGLLDDAIEHREPEAGTVTRCLRREERLEDPRLRVRVHAAAGVTHRQ